MYPTGVQFTVRVCRVTCTSVVVEDPDPLPAEALILGMPAVVVLLGVNVSLSFFLLSDRVGRCWS